MAVAALPAHGVASLTGSLLHVLLFEKHFDSGTCVVISSCRRAKTTRV